MEFLCGKYSIELHGRGRAMKGLCPFHAERSPSFTVDPMKGVAHCFGCGWHGDEFALFAALEGLEMKSQWPEILRRMAALAGLGPMPSGWKPAVRRQRTEDRRPMKKVVWPRVRTLSDGTCEELATLRGLSVEGVRAARDAGLIWGAMCGVRNRDGRRVYDEDLKVAEERNELRLGPLRVWLVGDRAGYVMQARRLDGVKWDRWDKVAKVHVPSYKADTIAIEGGAGWPVGAELIGERAKVALVEGGPDLLAAFHFARGRKAEDGGRRTEDVAVVSILGGAMRIHPEALPYFEGKRVRIFAHFDKLNPRNEKREGWEAAARWQEQLTAAGAEVDVWDFSGLSQQNGEPVGDLCDAAHGDQQCLEEMRGCMDFEGTIEEASL